jgi:polar amino acid transport system permease protein
MAPPGPEVDKERGRPSAGLRRAMHLDEGSLVPGDRETLAAWKLAFFGAIALTVALPLLRPHPFLEILAFVPDGLAATFTVTLASIGLALVLGLLAGLGRIARTTVLNRAATVYVEVVRGIPLLVQLFYIYYALGPLLHLNGLMAAIAALSICYGAYLAEIFRAGIQSIPRGQMEAALALGLTRTQALARIVLPQTVRVILPPIANEFIALLKDSSLVSILAVSDLLRRGREYASTSFDYLEAYTVVALIYLIMTLFFSRLVGLLEERMRTHGRRHD